MRAGKLRHRIALQSTTPTADAGGNAVRTWATYDTVYAEITALSGRTLWFAQQLKTEASNLITMRYRAGVSAAHRAQHDGRTFVFDAVIDPDGLKRELNIYCHEMPQPTPAGVS